MLFCTACLDMAQLDMAQLLNQRVQALATLACTECGRRMTGTSFRRRSFPLSRLSSFWRPLPDALPTYEVSSALSSTFGACNIPGALPWSVTRLLVVLAA